MPIEFEFTIQDTVDDVLTKLKASKRGRTLAKVYTALLTNEFISGVALYRQLNAVTPSQQQGVRKALTGLREFGLIIAEKAPDVRSPKALKYRRLEHPVEAPYASPVAHTARQRGKKRTATILDTPQARPAAVSSNGASQGVPPTADALARLRGLQKHLNEELDAICSLLEKQGEHYSANTLALEQLRTVKQALRRAGLTN